jgi:hypothetical protein
MVPMDAPLSSLEMMRAFMFGKSFKSYQQYITPKVASEQHSCPTTVCPSPAADETGNSCPLCSACDGDEDDGEEADDIRPGKAEEVSTPPIGETAKMQGPSWMFALWSTLVAVGAGAGCYYVATRIIQRRTLRLAPVAHIDSEGLEMRSY